MAVTLRVIPTTQGAADAVPASLSFDQPRVVIGRGAHADVRLPSRAVSDTHAVLHVAHGDLAVTDDASTNGTAVNGATLVRGRRKALRAGDRIAVPGYEIVVEPSLAAPDPPERTATLARRLLTDALAASGGEAALPEIELIAGRRPGQRWRLALGSVLVAGRGEGCDVVLDDADSSRQHAEFERDADGVVARDLGSKNGLLIADRRYNERRLRHGDEVKIGRSVLRFVDPTEALLRAFESGDDEPAVLLPPAPVVPAPEPVAVEATPAASSVEPVASTSAPPAAPVRTPSITPPRKPPPRTIDGVVIALAVLILAVSATALWYLLHGTPPPGTR